MIIAEIEKQKAAKDFITELRDCPGSSTTDKIAYIAVELRCQHRTHQANFIRNLHDLIVEYSKTTGVDGRNQGAVEFAQKVAEIDTCIPYV